MRSAWIKIALFNFFIAALMGLSLRVAHVVDLPWLEFKKMQHGHSHTAILGWLYMALYALILDNFLDKRASEKPVFIWLFWLAQVAVIGMAISFPLQGYAAVSISFSTLHLLVSYLAMALVWRHLKCKAPCTRLMLRTAIVFMYLSTLGVWMLGPVAAGLIENSALYYASIQFFLHFQFNGWFTFAILALVFNKVEQGGQHIDHRRFLRFYSLITLSCLLTYALAVAWGTPADWLFWANGSGVLLQLAALIAFLVLMYPYRYFFFGSERRHMLSILYGLALFSFAVRILMQIVVVIPEVAVISYTIRMFVVGFVHLMMLGTISLFLLAYLAEKAYLPLHTSGTWRPLMTTTGLIVIILGFFGSESLLFIQGLKLWMATGFWPSYFDWIAWVSLLFPLGILLLIIGTLGHRPALVEKETINKLKFTSPIT